MTIACGTMEENLPGNAAMSEALRRQGYDARFQEFRDGHNWVAWRDCFHPHLCDSCRGDLSERASLWSPAIRPTGVLVYGHWGRPLLAFPSEQGPRGSTRSAA